VGHDRACRAATNDDRVVHLAFPVFVCLES
jgi:hypothetical protein